MNSFDYIRAADVNGDGYADETDATLIKQYVSELIDHFPVEE